VLPRQISIVREGMLGTVGPAHAKHLSRAGLNLPADIRSLDYQKCHRHVVVTTTRLRYHSTFNVARGFRTTRLERQSRLPDQIRKPRVLPQAVERRFHS